MKEETESHFILPIIIMSSVCLLVLFKYGGFYYRSCINMLCFLSMAIYGTISSLVFPLIGKRHLIQWSVARGYYYLGKFFCGIEVKVEGQENLQEIQGPAIYVMNHQSSLDVMLMGKVYPKNTTVVAKKQLKYYPFLGWFMILSNAIFLDRKNRDSAVKEARKAAEDIHQKNINVWIFPEGTRGHAGKIDLLPFKKGPFYMAVQARVPIVPVVFSNYYDIYSAKEKRFTNGVVRCK
ncbi:1-acylglycerol-3-phosphate O-acyltransferase, partial [Rhizopus stolonifer]